MWIETFKCWKLQSKLINNRRCIKTAEDGIPQKALKVRKKERKQAEEEELDEGSY